MNNNLVLEHLNTSEQQNVSHGSQQKLSGLEVAEPVRESEPPVYLSGFKLVLVFSFLTNLDQTIVATALPRIVSIFDSLDLATWVSAGYFLTDAGLMLIIGQLLDTFPIKIIYLISVVLFEVGSVLCGAAPSMNVLIFGRIVAGCGAAGILICSIATIATFTRLEQRPMLFACFGALIAISSIVGPVLGGAFTDHVSWRWCFYINLPLGAVSFVCMVMWLPFNRPTLTNESGSLLQRLNRTLDWLFLLATLFISIYYLPLWYQINGRSSIQSGIDILPLMLSFVIAAALSSGITTLMIFQWTGYFWHVIVGFPLLAIVGSALLFTVTSTTSPARMLGYQILLGVGIGGSYQWTYVAIQADWADQPEETTKASGILTFIGNFGGLIGLSIAGAIFNNNIQTQLNHIPGLTPELAAAIRQSITVIPSLPDALQADVRAAAVRALRPIFLIGVVFSALGTICAIFIKNHNLHERSKLVASQSQVSAVSM
ncbi:MFS general substrate transporter [Panus rudis PR-1116 ss-1]|nr:MFS general substrate transporter [Panus rudis PR-1116 ss-1]